MAYTTTIFFQTLANSRVTRPPTQEAERLPVLREEAEEAVVLPLKPGVGQYVAMHATLTARDFFLANFYLSVHSPAFFQKSPEFFLC